MPTKTAIAPDGRRRTILDAALGLFASQGVHATSIDEICEVSDASVGSIYHHFGSKEGIGVALYAEAIAVYQRELRGLLRSGPTAETGIKGIVRHFLAWVQSHPALARLMLGAEHADLRSLATTEVRQMNRDLMADLGKWVTSCGDDLPTVPGDVMFALVLGPAQRFASSWVTQRTRTAIADASPLFADAAWAAVSSLKDR